MAFECTKPAIGQYLRSCSPAIMSKGSIAPEQAGKEKFTFQELMPDAVIRFQPIGDAVNVHTPPLARFMQDNGVGASAPGGRFIEMRKREIDKLVNDPEWNFMPANSYDVLATRKAAVD